MMYIQPPSALKATSVGSYAVGIKPMVWNACGPPSGITAMELEPALTAYSVVLAGLMVTAVGAAPVVFAGKLRYSGPRVSILRVILLVAVSMTATWSWLSCATKRVEPSRLRVMPLGRSEEHRSELQSPMYL